MSHDQYNNNEEPSILKEIIYGPDDGISISFYFPDFSFCEGKLNGGPPEYINALSSVMMALIGIYGLYLNKHNNIIVKFMFSSIIMNGIGSCGFHFTNYMGYGMIDRCSMILLVIFSSMATLQLFSRSFNQDDENNLLTYSSVIIASYVTVLMTLVSLGWENLFDIFFAFFLINTIIAQKILKSYNLELYLENPSPFRMANRGIKFIGAAGFIWILTEIFCHSFPILYYLHGHCWWHLFVAYGGYQITTLILYIDGKQQNIINYADFNRILPIVCFDSKYKTKIV
jgi:hypothetical protein